MQINIPKYAHKYATKMGKICKKICKKKHISSVFTAFHAINLETLGLENQQFSFKMSPIILFAQVE